MCPRELGEILVHISTKGSAITKPKNVAVVLGGTKGQPQVGRALETLS